MKNTIFRAFLLTFITSLFAVVTTTYAQTATPTPEVSGLARASQFYTCLSVTRCDGRLVSVRPGGPTITPNPNADKCGLPASVSSREKAHTGVLRTSDGVKVAINNKSGELIKHYILEVVMLDERSPLAKDEEGNPRTTMATTGKPETDAAINLCSDQSSEAQCARTSNYNRMHSDPYTSYTFFGLRKNDGVTPVTQPVTTTDGSIGPYLWFSEKGDIDNPINGRPSYFYDYYEMESETSKTPTGGPRGHIQGTWFGAAGESNCTLVRWDPFGKIVDAKSLEPLPGVKVTLKTKRDDGSYTQVTGADVPDGNIKNPITTKDGGDFSWVVQDGFYHLLAEKVGYTEVFPAKVGGSSSTQNAVDLSQFEGKYTDIYKGDPIEQVGGVPQHRNILLEPAAGTEPYHAPQVTVIDKTKFIDKINNRTVFKMRFSHPFTKADFYAINQNGEKRQLFTRNANIDGVLEVAVPHDELRTGETVDYPEATKVDLTTYTPGQAALGIVHTISQWINSVLTIGQVSAQTVSNTDSPGPILNYIKGCAYDSRGTKLPAGTTVGIYPTFSSKPYYTTTTDSTGCYEITSEYLPEFEYYIRYTTPSGQKIKETTAAFIKKNADYIKENKVDLNHYKDQDGNITPPRSNTTNNGENNTIGTGQGTAAGGNYLDATQKNSPIILILVIILLLLGVGGLVFALYLFKKNQQSRM